MKEPNILESNVGYKTIDLANALIAINEKEQCLEVNGSDKKDVSAYERGYMHGMSDAKMVLRQMPAVTLPEIMAQSWVSVEDALPDSEGEYITMTNAKGKSNGVIAQKWVFTTVRGKGIKRWEWYGRISPWIVTHWMPLPAPPATDKQ